MKKLHKYFALVDEKGKSYGKYIYRLTAINDLSRLQKMHLVRLKVIKVVVDTSDDKGL